MKRYFFSGLIIFLPIALTLALIIYLIGLLTEPFVDFFLWILSLDALRGGIQELLTIFGIRILLLIGFFFLTLLLGYLAQTFFFHSMVALGEKVVHKIPMFRSLYKILREITHSLYHSSQSSFQQVVLVPFPDRGTYTLGLVSQTAPKLFQTNPNTEVFCVFVPTTPTPTSGLLLFLKKEDLFFTNLSPNDVMKYVLSGAVILPEGVKKTFSGGPA